MQLVPNSAGASLAEYNHCHNPSCGPNCGGRFCSRGAEDAFVPAPRAPRRASSAMDRLTEPYGEHAAALREMHRQVTQLGQDGNEHLAILQPGGPPQYFTSGSGKFVQVDKAVVESVKQNPAVISMHNHPTGSAPSSQDLRSMVNFGSTRELIVGPDGEWYELHVTNQEKARQAVFEGRRYANWYTRPAKGKFETAFNRLRVAAVREAIALTQQYAEKTFGLKPGPHPRAAFLGQSVRDQLGEGFTTPSGEWLTRKEAGKLHPELAAYHSARFAELSPRIWIKLAERYKDWLQFRYHRSTGPYATSDRD